MYHSAGRRQDRDQHVRALEVALVVVCVLAVIALVVWIVATAGGGVLMT